MSEKTMDDLRLNERVYDAYQSFSPSDEAAERVLASLRKAQGEAPTPMTQSSTLAKQPVRWWKVALPLAACLALAVVMVQLQAPHGSSAVNAESAESATPEQQEYVAESDAATEPDATAGSDAAIGPIPEEVVVTLADHATYVVGEPLDEPPTFSALEEAAANDRPCVVADRAYMRYAGEETWYTISPR